MNEKAKIMVVEDERVVAEDIQRSLEHIGYDVIGVVSSGADAMARVQEAPPDLILMDIVIRGEWNGIETAKRIREAYAVPVVYLTAYADEDTLEKAKITEPFGYILKPFNDRELQSTIEMALYKHRMDKQLRKSEAWFSTTLRSIGDGVIATDMDGRISFMNALAEKLTGWDQEKAQGRSHEEIIDIRDQATGKAIVVQTRDIIRSERPIDLPENAVLRPRQGQAVPVDGTHTPIRDNRGEIIGTVRVFKDITERKRAEAAVLMSEEKYRSLFETMAQGVLYFDGKKRVLSWNPASERILGMDEARLKNAEFFTGGAHLVQEDRTPFPRGKDPLSRCLKQNRTVINEVLGFRTPSGLWKWLLADVTPVSGEDEKPYVAFATFSDITPRRTAELKLQERNDMLSSLNVVAQAVGGSLDLRGIMNKALNEVMVFADFHAGTLFLFRENEPGIPELSIHKKTGEGLIALMGKWLVQKKSPFAGVLGKGKPERFEMEPWLNGETLPEPERRPWKESAGLAIPIMAGETVVGILTLLGHREYEPTDVDYEFYTGIGNQIGMALKNARLYEKTNQALEQLRITQDKLVESEKLAGLGAMANNIVHEIGNPLAAIGNSIQVLQKRLHLEGRMKELMDIIGWETERLSRSVDELREFSRPRHMRFVEADMEEIIRKAIFVLNQDFELVWGRKLKTRFSHDLPFGQFDPDAMEQVALNLIKNGLQAVKEGGTVEVRLQSRLKDDREMIWLRVIDDGPGIPEADLSRIFDPYFSTKARGMGLGMHIVRMIVQSHDGEIAIDSTVGSGTTVSVWIPIKRENHGTYPDRG